MALSRLTRAAALAVATLILAADCVGTPAPVAQASPGPSTSASEPGPSRISPRPPAAYVLTSAQVGLPGLVARDHLGYLQAASEERDQATALELYQTFDWADEAVRTFGSGPRRAEEKLLISLRVAGARNAFAYWGALAVKAPLVGSSCPVSTGLDQCAEGHSGALAAAAGRRGVVVFYITATGADIDGLLRFQAAVLSAGPPA